MDRLTRYVNDIEKYDYAELTGGISQAVCNKLGKLEDIEEELGIPLYMYVSIKENGIKFKEKDTKRIFEVEPRDILLDAKNDILFVYWENSNDVYCEFKISNLGKTWWLNEESE